METAINGTMPNGPYNYQGVAPGWVATDRGAAAWLNEPYNKFISQSIKKGDFPLWDPYSGLAGAPLFADGQTASLEPIQFIFFLAPLRYWPIAMDLQLLIRFFLAGFFCYLFARRLKIDFLGSVVAGILFMLNLYFVTYGGHPQIKTESLLPLVLYGYDRITDIEDKRGIWICALSIGWAVIAGMPEAIFFSLFLGTLWYFYKTIFIKRSVGKKTLLRYVGATSIGFMLAAVYLLPLFEFISLATSGHSLPGAAITRFGLLSVNRIPGWIFGSSTTYPTRIGFVAFFALFFSLMNIKEWPDRRKEIIFFGGYACIFLFSILDSPLNLVARLPIFNQIVMYKYPLPSIHFCIAIITGVMIDSVRKFSFSNRKILLALFLVCGIIIVLPMAFAPTNFKYFNDISDEYTLFEFVIGISLAIIGLNVFLKNHSRILQIGIIPIILFETLLGSMLFTRPSRVYPFQPPQFINYLLDDTSSFRIVGLNAILFPNISTAYGIEDIRWVYALVPRRLWDFSLRFIDPEQDKRFYYGGLTFPKSIKMMNLLNVKYIISAQSAQRLDGKSAQPAQFDEAYSDKFVRIYQNNNVLPRAFVIYNTVDAGDSQSALNQMDTSLFDPSKAAVVENLPSELSTLINRNKQPIPFTPGKAELVKSGQLNVVVKSEAPGLLVVSTQYYPGWVAYVDGKSAPIYAVDATIQGVFLEKGEHRVEFKYQPLSFIIGTSISLISLFFIVVQLLQLQWGLKLLPPFKRSTL